MRFIGWQRIGPVLSVVWLLFLAGVGVAGYVGHDGGYFVETTPGQDVSAAWGRLDQCTQKDPELPAKRDGEGHAGVEVLHGHRDAQGRFCTDAHFIPGELIRVARTPDQHHFMLYRWLFCVFAPLAAAWFLAYLLIFCFRWVTTGFRKEL